MSDLFIRRATEDEAPKILDYIRKLAKFEGLTKDVKVTVDDIRDNIFNKSHARILLIYAGEAEIGFAIYYYTLSTFLAKPTLYLEDLYIDDSHRGKGYGKQVLAYLAKHAKKNNCARFEWSVLDWIRPSVEFYKSLGAKPLREWLLFRLDEENLDKLAEQAPPGVNI